MQIKLALPKGRLQSSTAVLLREAGFPLSDYHATSRSYRPQCPTCPELFLKVFQEKDIAVQVAIGNYDLGICGLDWIEEHLVKYSSEALVKIRNLGYGRRTLYALVPESGGDFSLETLRGGSNSLRIASEYPNLAESFALRHRVRRFCIFPVWGAAEVYPPENADVAIMAKTAAAGLEELVPLATLFESSAFLIANRNSLEQKDLSRLLTPLCSMVIADSDAEELPLSGAEPGTPPSPYGKPLVTLALPDGHQQIPTSDFLKSSGIRIEGYAKGAPRRRPQIEFEGVGVKVIRPQDMPLQVANGNFDLAITGRDWLWDHLYRFPASPVKELVDLGFGRVRVVAVVSNDLAISGINGLREIKRATPLRLASEYVNIADRYARNNHLTPYKVIPTWGASEAFLPEDADVLIENTETGSTIARHNLKIIDTLLESSACLIGNTEALGHPDKEDTIARLIQTLRQGTEARVAR